MKMRSAHVPRRRVARGFSLIELLVVMFIIGLMIGAVSLSVNIGGEPAEQIEKEADRLLQFSRLAEERSVLTGEPIGLVILPPGKEPVWTYRWQRYRGGQWVEARAPLEAVQLPENIEISLEVEGQLVNFDRLATGFERLAGNQDEEDENDRDEPRLPSIVFYPGGEVTPFLLTLFDAEAIQEQQVLTSNRIGRVEKVEDENEDFL